LIIFIVELLLVGSVEVLAPDLENRDRGHCVYAETEGVISGNLSDRSLADHGNIFGATFA
jgi:hypothetical protein